MTKRTTIWAPLGPEEPILRAAGVRSTAHIPVFVDGLEFEEFERTRRCPITAKGILFGALLHARQTAPAVDVAPFRESLPGLLAVLARGFEFDSIEDMVTSVAANLRTEHGRGASIRALDNAVSLYPCFHRARSDLIVDLWLMALEEQGSDEDRAKALRDMCEIFDGLDRSVLKAGPGAMACFAAVAGTALTRGVATARQQLDAVRPDIERGDEGQLSQRLEAFLAGGARDLSLLAVSVT